MEGASPRTRVPNSAPRIEKVTGEIGTIESRGGGKFEWKIQKFFSLPGVEKKCYWSPYFCYLDTLWYLSIWPNGSIDYDTIGWIDLFLMRRGTGPSKTMKLMLGIKKADGTVEILCEVERHTFSTIFEDFGKERFLKRCELMERQSLLTPSDTLTITCTIRSDKQLSMGDSLIERIWNLSRSFKNALDEGESADVLLKLKTRIIPAHRVVLKSRSTVFKNMLDSDSCVSKSTVIELENEDEDAFDVALSYMYYGELEKLNSKNVCEVYKIARKYNLQELREQCYVFIGTRMSADLVWEVIAMSYFYEDLELKECAKVYFSKNVTVTLKTETWKALKREKPELAFELLEWFAMQKES